MFGFNLVRVVDAIILFVYESKSSLDNLIAQRSPRVCYFGTYRAEYSRNQIMIEGLRRAGADVILCHETLSQSTEERVELTKGGWKHPRFWWRVIKVYLRLLCHYLHIGEYDVMVVGYPGQFDVFLARLLSRFRGKPLVWDVFMSTYLVALERKLDQASPFTVNMLRRIEKLALRQPDRLIQDTAPYVDWLTTTYDIPADNFRLVPTGADDRIFFPKEAEEIDPYIFRVLYYGTYIPNHGVSIIVEAAHLLADDPSIKFEFVGQGPDQARAVQMAKELQLSNITFVNWLKKSTLTQRIAAANLCLGVFGDTPQSLMTVQNKVYECLAMRKAVLTGSSVATQDAFENGVHLAMCERTPEALAASIRELRNDPTHCQQMAEAGWQLFHRRYDLQHIGETFAAVLQELVGSYNK